MSEPTKKKLEKPTPENYDKMKRVVKMLGRALNAEVKNCHGCRNRPEGLGPCRLCSPAKNVLAQARILVRELYSVKKDV